jgi:hypothetical protein
MLAEGRSDISPYGTPILLDSSGRQPWLGQSATEKQARRAQAE